MFTDILFKIKEFLKRGSSEALAFAYLAPLLCFLVIETGSFVQLNYDMHELTNALDVAGRAASVSTNIEDAEKLSQMIAESSIYSNNINNVEVLIDYATADDDWQAGLLLKVTISADIDTLSIVRNTVSSFKNDKETITKTMIYTVEGLASSTEEINLLAATIYMEGGSEEGMMAVGTVIMNRIDSSSYPNSLTEVIYAPMQFEVTTFPQFTNYISNPSTIPESAIRCATALLSGSRENRLMTCPYPSARNRGPCTAFYTDLPNLRRSTPMGISIAGNWFHWHW